MTYFKHSRRLRSTHVPNTDIQPFSERYSCATTKFIHIVRDDGYTYIVAQPLTCSEHRLRMDIEDQISPETKDMGQRLGIYPGKNSWNLPRSHRYHMLNFPPGMIGPFLKLRPWTNTHRNSPHNI